MAAIKVLGRGCHNCLELERRLAEALTQLGRTDVQVERVDGERTILHYLPLDAIPGLLIDDKPVSQRTVPDIETLLARLKDTPAREGP